MAVKESLKTKGLNHKKALLFLVVLYKIKEGHRKGECF